MRSAFTLDSNSPVPLSRLCRTQSRWRLLFLSVAVAALTACGGAGSGDDKSNDTDEAATGSVSIFITDAPSDEFDQILVDLEAIELVGGGAKVTLFSGNETIDLKDLENFSDLFVHAEDVPARKYNKIRLRVGRIQLVKNGSEAEVVEAKLPANGKIDLLPDESFHVEAGVDLVIELDMDARNSIHVVSTGNGGYRFRPVVHITIRDTIAPRKLARVHGEIRNVFDDENFALCPTMFMASRDVLESREDEESGGLGDRRRCMIVELNELTGVFDTEGDPIAGSELTEGDKVTVVGRFHLIDSRHDEDDEVNPLSSAAASDAPDSMLESNFEHRRHWRYDDDDDEGDDDADDDKPRHRPVRLVLLAYVIEAGPPGTFLRLRGEVETEVDSEDQFDFAIAPGQGFGSESVTTAALQEGTRVFTRRGIEVDDSEIVPGTEAKIDGVLSFGPMDGSLLKTALVVLNVEFQVPQTLRGKIFEIEPSEQILFLEVVDDDVVEEACVDASEDTAIFIIRETDDRTLNARASFEDLEVGFRVHAIGREGDRCLEAKTIIAFPPPPGDIRCRSEAQCEVGQFCDKPDSTCDGEGVCETTPRVCPLYFDPVCGCDGETYSNKCDANSNGTSVAHDGACDGGGIVCAGIAGIPCPDGMICQFPDDQCHIADGQGVCVEDPQACPEIYAPVCGCDGKTYSNRCFATQAGISISHTGTCDRPERCGGIAGEQCAEGEICMFDDGVCISDAQGVCVTAPAGCPEVYNPVCGCDDVTYSNECFARQAQVAIAHRGACDDQLACGGDSNLECDEGSGCFIEPGNCAEDAAGQCRPKPEACFRIYDPVCGCDGVTYSNSCVAFASGATVASRGACEAPPGECGGPDEIACPDGEVCLRRFNSCDSDAYGVCVDAPTECPTITFPVCGCDGIRYSNVCQAMRETDSVVELRACPEFYEHEAVTIQSF